MPPQFAQSKETQYICRNKVKRDMKANELMIGDWVAIGNNFIRVTSLQVSRNYPEANPIPLTAEILEKNGFGETDKCCNFKDNYCSISIYLDRIEGEEIDNASIFLEGALFDMHININYVHELQHALKLCGIDKEIVL